MECYSVAILQGYWEYAIGEPIIRRSWQLNCIIMFLPQENDNMPYQWTEMSILYKC